MYGVVATGRPASWVQLCSISIGYGDYGVHAFVQSALVEIKSASHIRFVEAAFLFSYAVHLYRRRRNLRCSGPLILDFGSAS